MSSAFTIREVRVEVAQGVTVVAEVEGIDGLKALIAACKGAGFDQVHLEERKKEPSRPEVKREDLGSDDPLRRLEIKAGISDGAMRSSTLLGFKDDVPQLLRPQALNVTDALLVLLLAIETGLKQPRIGFEAFKGLYEAQNIKSGSPFSMRINDLKVAGYIDKKSYAADRTVLLTAKGERKAIEVLKQAIAVA